MEKSLLNQITRKFNKICNSRGIQGMSLGLNVLRASVIFAYLVTLVPGTAYMCGLNKTYSPSFDRHYPS